MGTTKRDYKGKCRYERLKKHHEVVPLIYFYIVVYVRCIYLCNETDWLEPVFPRLPIRLVEGCATLLL